MLTALIPFLNPQIVTRVLIFLGALIVLWVAVDAIGDQREAKVIAKIDATIDAANMEIDRQQGVDEKLAAMAQIARANALAKARALPANALVCPANKAQAAALSIIR